MTLKDVKIPPLGDKIKKLPDQARFCPRFAVGQRRARIIIAAGEGMGTYL